MRTVSTLMTQLVTPTDLLLWYLRTPVSLHPSVKLEVPHGALCSMLFSILTVSSSTYESWSVIGVQLHRSHYLLSFEFHP